MSRFEDQVGFAKKVLAVIDAEGPRDKHNELEGRWRAWALVLRRDIKGAEIIMGVETDTGEGGGD